MKNLILFLLFFIFLSQVSAQQTINIDANKQSMYDQLFNENLYKLEKFDEQDYNIFLKEAIPFSTCHRQLKGHITMNVCTKDEEYIVELINERVALKKELHFQKNGVKRTERNYIYSILIGEAKSYNNKGQETATINTESKIVFAVADLLEKFKAETSNDLLDKSKYNVLKNAKEYIIMDKAEYKKIMTFDLKNGQMTKF